MPIKMLLKPLIGIIYTQLFKAVLLKKWNKKLLDQIPQSLKHEYTNTNCIPGMTETHKYQGY